MIQSKLRTFFSKGNRGTWGLFVVFVLTLVWKAAFFRYSTYQTVAVLPLRFFLAIFSIAFVIASLLFVFKRKYWIVYVSALLDFWVIANLWYFRSYNSLLDVFAISMVGNLNDGYWSAVQLLFEWSDLWFLLSTVLLGLSFLLFDNRKRGPLLCMPLFLLLGVGLHGIHTHSLRRIPNIWPEVFFNCFSTEQHTLLVPLDFEQRYTILHSLPKTANALVQLRSEQTRAEEAIAETDSQRIWEFIQASDGNIVPDGRLLLILIESWESWSLHPYIMPHLYQFMQSHPTLYARQVNGQVAGGMSSDAQLLANVGLMPIKTGAVSHLYASNLFPSIAAMYDSLTLSLSSTEIDDCWHQWAMNTAYHFDIAQSKDGRDSLLFSAIKDAVQRFHYTQAFTISTHSPFSGYAHLSSLEMPDEVPTILQNYVRSMNALDAGLSVLLSAVDNDSTLQNTTIVLMGDHAIFSNGKREEYNVVCHEQQLPFRVTGGWDVPLVIYSPKIRENIRIDELCYQMDVYPTMRHLVGCDDYFWKGFGVNLLDSAARKNRPITPEEAWDLSDKIIRADYFRTIVDSLGIQLKDGETVFEP